jgi:hypothetical protein
MVELVAAVEAWINGSGNEFGDDRLVPSQKPMPTAAVRHNPSALKAANNCTPDRELQEPVDSDIIGPSTTFFFAHRGYRRQVTSGIKLMIATTTPLSFSKYTAVACWASRPSSA